jgi:hypothetical protein
MYTILVTLRQHRRLLVGGRGANCKKKRKGENRQEQPYVGPSHLLPALAEKFWANPHPTPSKSEGRRYGLLNRTI